MHVNLFSAALGLLLAVSGASSSLLASDASSRGTADRLDAGPAEDYSTTVSHETDLRDRMAEVIERLDPQIPFRSHPRSIDYAVRAYVNFQAANPHLVKKPYLYFVDYGLDSRTPRGYVIDMAALRVIHGPFMVSHGRGSESDGSGLPTRFLNVQDSNATSLGLYLAEEMYGFSGRAGGRYYRSPGLRLRGVSGRFNDAARDRGIVVHGAPYVTDDRAGRSEGCPAVDPGLAADLIPRIAEGGLVFHFSPLDTRWMREDPWAGVITPTLAGIF